MKIDIYNCFFNKLRTIQHIIIFWKQMLHYALKPKSQIKAIIFFYTEILQKKLLVLKISLSLKKIR